MVQQIKGSYTKGKRLNIYGETGFGPKHFFSHLLFYGLANDRMGLLNMGRIFSTWNQYFSATVLGPKISN